MPAWHLGLRRAMLGGDRAYSAKILALFGSSIAAYWPQWEPAGSVSTDIGGRSHPGAYTGVTLAQPGIGDGRASAQYDGTTSVDNVYSAGLSTDFNGAEGTLAIWAKVSGAGVWTDTVGRTAFLLLLTPSNDFVSIQRTATNNQLALWRFGTTGKQVSVTITSTAWMHLALTWSVAADNVIGYVNGAAQGAPLTGLGAMVGSLLSSRSVIGAGNSSAGASWSGLLAHALLLNRAATPTEVLAIATVP
jgi:Concanavalin A-like lectin/glucanases superfamily